jgi:hypothetical protein
MKKLAILSMTFVFVLSIVQGQTKETKKSDRVPLKKLEGTTVSTLAKNNFSTDFKDAKEVQWKRFNTYDEATFTNNDGHQMTAFYDNEGQLVGTSQNKTFADLPVKGQEQIKKLYKDYIVGKVVYFDDNEANYTDMIMYGNQFDDADNYFVELTKGDKKIVVEVNMDGSVSHFKSL